MSFPGNIHHGPALDTSYPSSGFNLDAPQGTQASELDETDEVGHHFENEHVEPERDPEDDPLAQFENENFQNMLDQDLGPLQTSVDF